MLTRINSALLNLIKPLSATVDQNSGRQKDPSQQNSEQTKHGKENKEAKEGREDKGDKKGDHPQQPGGDHDPSMTEGKKKNTFQPTLVPKDGTPLDPPIPNGSKPESTKLFVEFISTYQAIREGLTQKLGRNAYGGQGKNKAAGNKLKKGAIVDDKVG